jgi:CelD/BcsL family acetyltransferase involved in cellulose biosynthesis
VHAPIASALRVERRALAELAAHSDAWRALAARALEPNVFYEPEFALPAAPVFGANVSALLVWSASGQLLGFFPSRRERRYGAIGVQTGWTHPYGPLGLPLVDREHAIRVVAAWLNHLAHEPDGPSLLLLPLLPEGPFATALHSVLGQSGCRSAPFGRHRRALLKPGEARADYLQRALSPKRRKEIRRLRRRLEDLTGVSHVRAASPNEVAAATQEFLRLEASGWKGAARTAAALKPPINRFVELALGGLAAAGKARADLLLAGQKPIAAAITLSSGDTAWSWKIAYDESFSRYSPGVQLLLDVTGELLAPGGPAQADSCAVADHPMIDPIWRERLVVGDLLVAVKPQSRFAFALACRAETARRRAQAAAKALLHRLRG